MNQHFELDGSKMGECNILEDGGDDSEVGGGGAE